MFVHVCLHACVFTYMHAQFACVRVNIYIYVG